MLFTQSLSRRVIHTCVVNEDVHVGLRVVEDLCGVTDGLQGGKVKVVDEHNVASLLVDLLRRGSGFLKVTAQHHHTRPCHVRGGEVKRVSLHPSLLPVTSSKGLKARLDRMKQTKALTELY